MAGSALAMLVAALVVPTTIEAAVVPITPVPSSGETAPVAHTGDTADDPAIWVDHQEPIRSLIIGNDKGGALESYDLQGALVQRIPTSASNPGHWGNVDVRQDLGIEGVAADVAVVAHGGLQIYAIDPTTRTLSNITEGNAVADSSTVGEGLCLYHSAAGDLYAFAVTRANGVVRQYRISAVGNGLVTGTVVRTITLGSEAEGCVVDDTTGALYVSQETVALWRFDAAPTGSTTGRTVDTVVASGGRLAPDIEGLTAARQADGTGVLIASAQNGANRPDSYFAVYDLDTNAYIDSFRVVDGPASDDCDGTDGITAYAGDLGTDYPNGLFVCQDNNNDAPGSSGNQNFKYAPMTAILAPAVSPGPAAPKALATVSCTDLSCTMDGSASNDNDGTIVSYDWDFGDGAHADTAGSTHTYTVAGTYAVELTVTDNDELTGTSRREIVASHAPVAEGPVTYVASATAQGNWTTGSVSVPSSAQAGDTLLLFVSTGAASITTPAGWTVAGTRRMNSLLTTLYTRTATAGNPGSSVPVKFTTLSKYTLTLADYRGADAANPVSGVAAEALGLGTARRTPTVDAPTGGTVVSYWSDQSSSTTSWTGPDGAVRRVAVFGTGGGRITSLLADSGTAVTPGAVGALSATSNAPSSRATTWTVVLKASGDVPPPPPHVAPVARINVTCVALACSADGTTSTDSDGQIVSYAWTFGDGSTASTATASHTYTASGNYDVTLTVTDNNTLTGVATQSVQVAATPPPPPHVPPVARINVICDALACSADGTTSTDSDGQIVSYAWTFGDGATASTANASHTYTTSGNYDVTLTVTDNNTLTGVATQSVQVAAPPPPPPAATGTLSTWGTNDFGQLGDGTTVNRFSAGSVAGLTDVISVHGGREHALALRSDGSVYAWGSDQFGQLGLGGGGHRSAPTPVPGLSAITAVTTGHYHSLALASDGQVWAWGMGSYGQLGDGTTNYRNAPVKVFGLDDAVSIAAGRDMSYAIRADGSVWAWGQNTDGQLGDGTTTDRSTPVRVGSLTSVIEIAGGRDHGLAVRSDGSVWAWGWNQFGQLGDGTTDNRTSPVQVASSGYRDVIGGAHHSYGLRTDGQVMSWGRNYRDELGDGTTIDRATPVPVIGVTGAVAIGSGRDHGLAVMADGTLKAWGWNADGQLGDGTTTARTTAITVPGVSGATEAAGGQGYSIALVGQAASPPPNRAPTALLTVTCSQLTCHADGSASSDPDGPVSSYAWDFGDGTHATGVIADHTYSTALTATVTLTVTDPGALTGTASQQVTVNAVEPTTQVNFVATASSNANTSNARVVVPAAVQAGDGLVLIASSARSDVTVTTPSGWALVDQASAGPLATRVYRRTADASDAGATVAVPVSSLTKTALQIVAYRGVAPGSFVTAAFTTSNTSGSARTAPAATVGSSGAWVLNYWSDRSSADRAWTAPAGSVVRSTTYGTGGGRVTALLADSGGAVPTGSFAARTATTSASGSQAIGATLVLTPA